MNTFLTSLRPALLRAAALLALLGAGAPALAHNPMAECKSAANEQIQCTGGFSDGSGAPGVTMDVISYDEQILVPGKLDQNSQLTFKRPEGDFYVLFDAGPGHVVEIDHVDIQ
ncbi:FIG137877: Hypothetical protein in pyoverdin gene cluster [plant metagenome]|uniref:Uncharacterized protein n=2 Tax=root TaxID=1 RepID=A0A1C3JYP5_9BURK|nr:hypothetical protein [Orrella dioscoreae]SBT24278.1 FIG137877: Hypothetical protein in pyoverdin gene cluster [Orrella dioscoreae]SOE49869.1 FIG137877: Hypothetical protein in pyoverdin gene cluster [Orrella dioscoreae]